MAHDTLLSPDDCRLPALSAASCEVTDPDCARALRVSGVLLLVWCASVMLLQARTPNLTTMFFVGDSLWLMLIGCLLLGLGVAPGLAFAERSIVTPARSRRIEVALACAVALAALIGARVASHGYGLSRDEAMAGFDATILRHGQLLASIPPAWRPDANALEPTFVLPIAGNAAWISTYLPGNAAIRAIFDAIPGVGLASPLLAALSIVAVFGVARRLWPERPDAAVVAGLLLATSTQFIVTAFTPYAMTAHLALDLVWLWLFLRDDGVGHAGAIAVAALACGLHQLIFHPLFAAPFVLQLWAARRWRLAALYTAAYAAICLFWVLYWHLVLSRYGLRGDGATSHGIGAFVAQIVTLLRAFDWSGLDLMAKNLTRFLAWQNPMTLPLAGIAIVALRRLDGPLAALTAGMVLTTVAMFVLLPYQGHGWGYRYLHGLLGSLCLVAAQGWIAATRVASRQATARLGLATLFAVFVMLPGRAFEAERFSAPFAAASRAIEAADTDLVLVDTDGMPFSVDLVRNDPFLRNRPLVMALGALDPARVARLCATHTVSLFDRLDGDRFHLLMSRPDPRPSPARARLDALGCGIRLDGTTRAPTP